MFPFHLPVFINQLDLRFVKEALKTVIKCIWKFVKTRYSDFFPSFPHFEISNETFYIDPMWSVKRSWWLDLQKFKCIF